MKKFLFCGRINNSNGGTYSGVTNGIIYATDNGADIINMSLRGLVYNQAMADACKYAYENGVIVFAATGNDSTDTIGFPAAFDYVMAVGAIDQDRNKTTYSNWGPEIDIVAPGGVSWPTEEGIIQQINDGSFIFKNGTSMATPHASGFAAILKSLDFNLSNSEIESIIKLTTEDIGKQGWDMEYGYGLINPLPAVNFVIGEGEDVSKSIMVKIKDNSDEISWEILSIEGEISLEIYFLNEEMNLDLFLYDPNGILVASSESNNDYENISYNATEKGKYIITITKSK